MSRLKLVLPDKNVCTVDIPVRISDINYGNHVGNDSLVSIIHEARVQWLTAFAYTELDIAGAALILADLLIEYKSEAFYGDMLTIKIYTGEIQRAGFEIYYEITTDRKGKNILVAKAKTGMVCFNYAKRKVISMPEELISFLNT